LLYVEQFLPGRDLSIAKGTGFSQYVEPSNDVRSLHPEERFPQQTQPGLLDRVPKLLYVEQFKQR
jgi:hypothetical protein